MTDVPGRLALEHPDAPPWYKLALADYGMRELTKDGGLNPRVHAMLLNHTHFPDDLIRKDTAWCAAAMSSWIERAGFKSAHSASAAAYEKFGEACDWKIGCVVVVPRTGGSGRHVTLYAGDVDAHTFIGYGGNQRNGCFPSFYPKLKVVARRWPKELLSASASRTPR